MNLEKKDSSTNNNFILAGLGERLVAQIIDDFISLVPLILSLVIMIALGNYMQSKIMGTFMLVSWISSIVFCMYYILFSDAFKNGQSYGKEVMKIAVVQKDTGNPCSSGKSFLRNFSLWLLGIIDVIFIFGGNRQRLGDKFANTMVVSTKK